MAVDIPYSNADAWDAVVRAARTSLAAPTSTANKLFDRYGFLLAPPPEDRPFVVAHLAQSLDGAVALRTGQSQWITGKEDLLHTHRLRALVDAVIVGAETVHCDDPQLTVRRCSGANPIRIVLDPRRRSRPHSRVFSDGLAPTWTVVSEGTPDERTIVIPPIDGVMSPAHILRELHARGLQRVLIEGGGVTVARFLEADCVDRLHLVIAPLLVGAGRASLPVALCTELTHAIRPHTTVSPLGSDWLFDCNLRPA